MKNRTITGILLLWSFVIACNSVPPKPLKLPVMHQIGNKQKVLQIKKNKTLLIYINGDCGHCIMDLNKLDSLIQNSNIEYRCQLSFFTDAFDTTQFKELKNRLTSFTYPVFYDKEQLFWKPNKLNISSKDESYYIENNHLLLHGDFIFDSKYRKKVLYKIQ